MGRKKSFINNFIFAFKYAMHKEVKHSWMLTCECCGGADLKPLGDGHAWNSGDSICKYWMRAFKCNSCGSIGVEYQSWSK